MRYESAALLIVFSFGAFLLFFPNFGPASLKLIEVRDVDPYTFFSSFYISHICGILLSAMLLDRVRGRVKLAKGVAALLVVLSALTFAAPLAILAVGFAAGIFVVVMGSFLARFVEPWKRGRVFALGASLANLYLFLAGSVESLKALLAFAVLPLLLMAAAPEVEFEVRRAEVNMDFLKFFFPVFIFYLLGGIMYADMEPVFRESGIEVHVLFYAVAILLAGYLYDTVGRKPVSMAGVLLLSLSFLLFPTSLALSAYLIQSAYAFIDVFAMVVWADLSRYGSEARQYGVGMLSITSAILLGLAMSRFFSFQINTLLAVLLLLFSAFFIGTAKEPLTSPEEYARWMKGRWTQ